MIGSINQLSLRRFVIVWLVCVFIGLICACNKKTKVEYDRWKNVVANVTIGLPEIRVGTTEQKTIPPIEVKDSDVIRFQCRLVRDAEKTILGSSLVIMISKRLNGKDLSFNSCTAAAGFADGLTKDLEMMLKAPKSKGTYKISVRVSGSKTDNLVGSIRVK